MVTENKLASRGMNLQNIAPLIVEGEKIVQLDQDSSVGSRRIRRGK